MNVSVRAHRENQKRQAAGIECRHNATLFLALVVSKFVSYKPGQLYSGSLNDGIAHCIFVPERLTL